MTEDKATPVELLFERAEDYGKTSIELYKLNLIDRSADVISSLAVQIVIFTVVIIFTISVSIGVALWLGQILGTSYSGFFVIAGFYGFVGLLLYTFWYRFIKIPLANSIINQMLKLKHDINTDEKSWRE